MHVCAVPPRIACSFHAAHDCNSSRQHPVQNAFKQIDRNDLRAHTHGRRLSTSRYYGGNFPFSAFRTVVIRHLNSAPSPPWGPSAASCTARPYARSVPPASCRHTPAARRTGRGGRGRGEAGVIKAGEAVQCGRNTVSSAAEQQGCRCAVELHSVSRPGEHRVGSRDKQKTQIACCRTAGKAGAGLPHAHTAYKTTTLPRIHARMHIRIQTHACTDARTHH